MSRQPSPIDFSPFESLHPRIFAMLREQGWSPQRFVEFPEIPLEGARSLILTDFPRAFLHSFFGLELSVKQAWGKRRVLLGFDDRLNNLMIDDYVTRLDSFCDYNFPYPVLTWETLFGFTMERAAAFAVDDFYQVYVRAPNPFFLAEHVLFGDGGPNLDKGYIERKNMPADYWHLIWNRPLDYHGTQYEALALREGDQTQYVLQCRDYPDLFQITVSKISEMGTQLVVNYRRADTDMPISVASSLVVSKLLDEFFEGTYREHIRQIELRDDDTGQVTVAGWP